MAKTWVTHWPRHGLQRWPRHGLERGAFGRSGVARQQGPDLCIRAPGRRAARMPGTGPQRRSSAPARIKALVRKSRFRAAALRSPRRSFFRPMFPITRCGVFGIWRLTFFCWQGEWGLQQLVRTERSGAEPRRFQISPLQGALGQCYSR